MHLCLLCLIHSAGSAFKTSSEMSEECCPDEATAFREHSTGAPSAVIRDVSILKLLSNFCLSCTKALVLITEQSFGVAASISYLLQQLKRYRSSLGALLIRNAQLIYTADPVESPGQRVCGRAEKSTLLVKTLSSIATEGLPYEDSKCCSSRMIL